MADHANLQILRQTLAAFRTGDVAPLTRLFSKDVVWHVPGKSFLSKDYNGRDEVFAFFARLGDLTNGTFKVESLQMFANNRGGVFVDRLTAERDGKKLDIRLLLHVTIRSGQIVEGFDYLFQEHLWDSFWGSTAPA